MNFTADRDSFAAAQGDVQKKDEHYLIGSARAALRRFGKEGWFDALLNRVEQVARTAYRRESGHVSSDTLRARINEMRKDLAESLAKTKDPAGHIEERAQALSKSLSSLANAVGVEAASHDDENDIGLEWVTMHDDRVRSAHAAVDGQVRRPHEKYDVGGFKMSRPGDTTVPIELWINCRCALRPVRMDSEAITASTISAGGNMDDDLIEAAAADPVADPMMDDNIDDLGEVDDFQEVRFHGVLAPEGVMSGDGRKFREGVMRWRDLSLPMAWQKVNMEGHDGSVVVGHIDDIWRDENNLLQYEGGFTVSPESDEVISLVADRSLRGVSVDVDDATMSFEDEDGNEVTFDSMFEQAADGEDPGRVVSVITDGRICGATICAIPAFQEAYISLGPHPEKPGMSAVGDYSEDEFRTISAEERDRMAKNGQALPDGSYPIANVEDLKNAIQAIGRAKDPAKAKAHIKKRASALGQSDLIPDDWSAEVVSFVKTEDGPGWLTHPVDTERLRRYWTKGKGAQKIRWGVPGDFNRCRAELAKYVKPIYLSGYCANRHYDALGFWPGRPTSAELPFSEKVQEDAIKAYGQAFHLVASADERWLPPREFYDNPGLLEPTTLTITDTGHVFGHLAEWGVCHIGMDGVCTTPPYSDTDYAFFAKGTQATSDGDVRVGVLTIGTGHAGPNLKWSAAAAHYDNTGSICATVSIGEDEHGIWFSGAIPPWVTEKQRTEMRAVAAVSGDWRRIGEYMELVAGLVVNVPGFPISPTQIAASGGHQTALVASGIVMHQECRPMEEIVSEAVEAHMAMLERRKAMAELAVEAGRDPASKMAALAAGRK